MTTMRSDEMLLGVDIGTMSTKGVLARPDGRVAAIAERAHTVARPRPGHAEHEPEATWWADVVAVCHELGVDHARIAAVCASGIGATVLPVDASRRPLRPAILYGVDTRATAEIAELDTELGADRILARCGSRLSTQSVGPKLRWLQRHEPEVWRQTRGFLMASSFVVERLTGEYVLDHHSASQSEPLYELARHQWIPDWADHVAPGVTLPELAWPGEVVGTVTPSAAEATGLAVGTPVAAGTIDAWAEALSVGVERPGDRMLMYGSTMFVIEVQSRPRFHPALWGTVGLTPGMSTLAAGMATSGALTAWLQRLTGGEDYAVLAGEAARVAPGSNGLVVLPYFAGERTPLLDPDARGVIAGLTLSHERGHIYRAALEGTAYGVRHILEVMGEAGSESRRTVAVGGGTRGGSWPQIVSDVTGVHQEVPEHTVGAAYGDALLAARAVGLAGADTTWSRTVGTVAPAPEHRDRYDELYDVYRRLYPATKEQMHVLADLQRR